MKQIIAACLGLVLAGFLPGTKAEIVQGQLELRWGDPVPVHGKSQAPSKFVATLVGDDGTRRALDPAQAKRAASDLYALANRRVAVEFSQAKRGGATVMAIVPADRLQLPGLSKALLMPKAVTGNTRWVTVACKFSDIAEEQKPVSFFSGQYGTDAGQLGHYWKEVSYNKINLTGSSAYGWFTLPQPRSFYVTKVDGKDKANLDQLFKDCATAADPTVDFNSVQGINMMFNGDLDGFAWGGGACGLLEGVNKCISNTWNPPWSFGNLAPLAHEMGHGYGLPHSDNSDGDDDTYDNPWDVMSDAWNNAVSNATYGTLPKHINIVQRDRLGWVDAPRKLELGWGTAIDEVKLDYASLAGSGNPQMIVLYTRDRDSRGIFVYTIEARKPMGAYEAQLAGNAVIIHAIATSTDILGNIELGTAYSVDASVPPADTSNNEGSMFKVGETWVSPDGSRMVKVLSATANGFIIRIGNWHLTGGPSLPRTKPAAVAQPAHTQSAPGTATRRHPGPGCGDSSSANRCKDSIR